MLKAIIAFSAEQKVTVADGEERAISFEKFATMMDSSYRRRFRAGEAIFRKGEAVDGFYIVTEGECFVQASARYSTTGGFASCELWHDSDG